MRAALDTNILVYEEGLGDSQRVEAGRLLLEQTLSADVVVVPVQCLGELFRVLTGKAGRSREDAQNSVLSWMDAYKVEHTTPDA